MLSRFTETVTITCLGILIAVLPVFELQAQCPTLDNSATLTSPDCQSGNTPCDLCPGDVMTLTGNGTGLQPGDCINWYYGTTSNFNPYLGEGTLMGCSGIEPIPPNPCGDCPILLSLFINACGAEENNEYMVAWSGSGFNVDNFNVDFDASNNVLGAQNDDIGLGSCGWQEPTGGAVASVQTICPNATVVGAGPGEVVPAGVPVIIFTSASYDFNYNFGGLCPLAPVIYVMQNGCSRSTDAFTNTGSGTQNTSISLNCGCSSSLDYQLGNPSNNDGDFVIWTPIFPIHGNLGCGFPSIPSFPGGGAGNPFQVEPFDYTVTPAMCGGGPYWVVGVVDPLPGGCPEPFTNYMSFDVPCPPPNLGTDQVCEFAGLYDLTQLEDPNLQGGGVWSGPGVVGNALDPLGLSGTVTLTFTPNSDCSVATTTTVDILPGPTAAFGPYTPTCAGGDLELTVNLTGAGPWTFDVLIDGFFVSSQTANSTPYTFTVNPLANSVISIDNFADAGCPGQPTSIAVDVAPSPEATLVLVGAQNVCQNQPTDFRIDFSGGTAPYSFEYSINGAPQGLLSTNDNPYFFSESFNSNSTITLTYFEDAECIGVTNGSVNISIQNGPTAQIPTDSEAICDGETFTLEVLLTGNAPPYTVEYSIDGMAPISVGGIMGSPFLIPIIGLPVGSHTIELVDVMDANGCSGDVFGLYEVEVIAIPTVTLSGGGIICQGECIDLQIEFTGTPGFSKTMEFEVNGGCPPFEDPCTYTTMDLVDVYTVCPPDPGTYVYTPTAAICDITNNGGCVGPAFGSATVIVLPAPQAVLESGTTSVCFGDPVSLDVALSGAPLPLQFSYLVNGVIRDTIFADESPFTFEVDYGGPGINTITLGHVSNDTCGGFVSGTYNIFVQDSVSATLTGGDTICGTGAVDLTVNFTGTPPFEFTYTANDTITNTLTAFSTPFTFQHTISENTVFKLVSVTGDACAGTVAPDSAVFVVLDSLGATISGGGQICQGDSVGTDIIITFTGDPPYYYIYNAGNGNPQPVDTAFTPTVTIPVNPNVGTVYSIDSVWNNTCTGDLDGSTAVVFVFTPANAILFGNSGHCFSADTAVYVDFTGTGPFEYVYTCNGDTLPPVTTFNDPDTIPVMTNVTQVYRLVSVRSPGCVGIIDTSSAVVTIFGAPDVSNIMQTCDQANGTYTVSFDINNGIPPYMLDPGCGGTGTFTGNSFTSDPIPIDQAYSICFYDSVGCDTIEVSDQSKCNCTSMSGTVQTDTLVACIGDSVTVVFNNDAILDADDTIGYVLHDFSAFPLGNVLAYSTEPTFGFQPGVMLPNTLYRISVVVGNNDGSGQVDLNDLCLSVSIGAPVRWLNFPQINPMAPDTACVDSDFVLSLNLTGVSPFSLSYTINGNTPVDTTGISGPVFSFPVPLDSTVLIEISIEDALCVNPDTDTVQIVVNDSPGWGPVQDSCDLINNTYTLTIPLTGQAPFQVTGLSGNIVNDTFFSAPQPFGQSYFAELSDVNNCGVDTLEGASTCGCISDAGTMDLSQPGSICGDDSVMVVHNGDEVLAPNDTLYFVLHTGPANVLGTVLDSSAAPVFGFDPVILEFDSTYFVSAIVKDKDGNNLCEAFSAGVPVIWRTPPTATLTGGGDVCLGQVSSVSIVLTGTAPFNIGYTSNGNANTVQTNNSPFVINAILLDTTVYQLTSVNDAFCPGTVSGMVEVNPHPEPEITDLLINCAPGNTTYNIQFTLTNTDLVSAQVTGFPNGTLDTITGVFTSDAIPVDSSFSFTVSDQWMCGTADTSGSVICCVTDAGSLLQDSLFLCNEDTAFVNPAMGIQLEPGDTLLYYLVDTIDPGNWNVLAINTVPTFAFNSMTMSPDSSYFIIAVAGNQLPAGGVDPDDPCLSIAQGPVVQWQNPISGSLLLPRDTVCPGEDALFQALLSGGPDYTIVWSVNGINQPPVNTDNNVFEIMVPNPTDSTVLILESASIGACLGSIDNGEAIVRVEAPFDTSNFQITCDPQQLNFVLTFDIETGPGPAPPYYNVSGLLGSLNGNAFVSDLQPVATGYDFVITSANGCPQAYSGPVVCVCTTDAGTLTLNDTLICTNDTIGIVPGGDEVLGPNDGLVYIMHSDPNDPLGSQILISNVPQIAFDSNLMMSGVTYYITAMAGFQLPGGGIDTTDQCLSLSSIAAQVQFSDPPTLVFDGLIFVCPGDNASFQAQFTGVAPFDFGYTQNGNPFNSTSPGPTFSIGANNIQQRQTFIPTYVSDRVCDGTVSGSVVFDLYEVPSVDLTALTPVICEGASAVLEITVNGGTAADFDLAGGPSPVSYTNLTTGDTIIVFPNGETTYSVLNAVITGGQCPPRDGDDALVTISDLSGLSSTSNFNGFQVSCQGQMDGQITITPQGGQQPYAVLWNTGETTFSIGNLPVDTFAVTVTDAAGCVWSDSIALTAPDSIQLFLFIQNAGCAGEENGAIVIDSVPGAVLPYEIVINGFPVSSDSIGGLAEGEYTIEISDANACMFEDEFDIISSPPLFIDAGPDVTVSLGDYASLSALTNANGFNSIAWTPFDSTFTAPNALTTLVQPSMNTRFTITVEDGFGCVASDSLRVIVINDNRVYIPNVFRPTVQDGNERFTIFSGPEVNNIRFLQIYDRWGEMVFEGKNMMPNEVTIGWDGNWNGEPSLPGVYIYVAELEFIDGSTKTFSGDLTLLR